MRAEGTLPRQQTVKRTFGMRCVGVTLIPPDNSHCAFACVRKSGGLSTDTCLRHIHIPLELLLFQRSRQATSLQLFWLIFPKKHFLDCKKIVSDCLDCRYKNRCIYMRRKPLLLVGRLSLCGGGTAAYSPATAIFCALVASCTPSVDTLARHTYMPRGTRRPLRSVRSQVMAAERNMSLRPLC